MGNYVIDFLVSVFRKLAKTGNLEILSFCSISFQNIAIIEIASCL